MTKFLTGDDLTKAIREITRPATDELYLIVAYWGDGGLDLIGLSKEQRRPIRILCDVNSGSCNPAEISRLRRRKDIALRHQKNLHAKVYFSKSAAVVCSANASTNGHGVDRVKQAGLLEAGIRVVDRRTLEDIGDWCKKVWSSGQTIGPKLMAECEAAWMRRRLGTPGQVIAFADLLKADRDVLLETNAYVAWYNYDQEDPDDKEALKELNKLEKELGLGLDYWAEYGNPLRYKEGQLHITAYLTRKKDGSYRATYEGVYEVLRDTRKLRNGTFYTPLRRRKELKIAGAKVLISAEAKQQIILRLNEQVKKSGAFEGFEPLADFFGS